MWSRRIETDTDWCDIWVTFHPKKKGGDLVAYETLRPGSANPRRIWETYCETEQEALDEFDVWSAYTKPVRLGVETDCQEISLQVDGRNYRCRFARSGVGWEGEVLSEPSLAGGTEWGDTREHLAYLLLPMLIKRGCL